MDDRDPVTGLMRTGTFQAELDARCRRAESNDVWDFTVALVDILELNKIRDEFGWPARDELLKSIAQRLESGDFSQVIARVGDDRFALLADGIGGERGSQWTANIRLAFLEPFTLADREIRVRFHVTRRGGPPTGGRDLLWQVERDAFVDRTRELRQRLNALERAFAGVSDVLGQNLELRSSLTRYRELALRDPLTGLLNRRGLFDRTAVIKPPFALAFADLDDLRALNDLDKLWSDGDGALCGVADRFRETFGDENVVRWGGDEYLVFAPGATAVEMAGRLQRLREQCRHDLIISGRPITFSAGVTDCPDGDLEAAQARAQRAVKEAKKTKATIEIANA